MAMAAKKHKRYFVIVDYDGVYQVYDRRLHKYVPDSRSISLVTAQHCADAYNELWERVWTVLDQG